MASSLSLVFDLLARDNASATFRKVGDEAEKAGKKGQTLGQSIGNSLQNALPSLKGFSASISSVAGTLAGAGLAAGLGAAISKSIEFEKAMSGAAAASMAGSTQLAALRSAAIKAGADTQYSATEAANAITEMAKAGVSTSDILKGGLTGALNLAAAGQIDVADAASIASTALTQFNLAGRDLPHVADLLAAGAGKAQGGVDDLGQALNQAGLIASAMGISIEDTTGALAAFASAGLIGSDAGTSFKTMLQALQNPTQKSATLMEQLGIHAYDAQGGFVGLDNLAGQLQGSLSGLTQAQRDQALAQIFGSDAVRAANVLYKQGAQGIQEWTAKVNDSGYAQRQAAALTDNLAGDIERLGGSFDTFLISVGSGLQGPLRGLVQSLGGLVDIVGGAVQFFSRIPGPVQAAAVAFGLWAVAGDKVLGGLRNLLGGPLSGVSGGFKAFGEALGYARQNGDGLGTVLKSVGSYAGGQAVAGLKALAKAVGPELGIAAATLVITTMVEDLKLLGNAGGAAADDIKQVTNSLRDIDGNQARIEATTQAINKFRDELAATRAQMEKPADPSAGASLLGLAGTAADLAVHLRDDKAAADEYQAAISRLEAANKRADASAGNLAQRLGISKDAVIELADKYNIDLTGSTDSVIGRFLQLKNTTEQVDTATGNAGVAADVFTQQLQDAADAASAAKTQTNLLKTSLDVLTGQTVDLSQVEADFYDAVQSADGALKNLTGSVLDNTGHLNVQSEAGRKAQDVLFGIRDADNLLIATMVQQGATTDQVRAKDAQLRESFIQSAQQMGISRQRAEELANQILGIPAERTTKITADTGPARASIQGLINDYRGYQINLGIGGSTGTYAAADGGILPGFTPGRDVHSFTSPTGGRLLLSGGESVMRPEWTRAVGSSFVGRMNKLARTSGVAGVRSAMGFADGGIVPADWIGGMLFRTGIDSGSLAAAKRALMPPIPSFSAVGSGVARWAGLVGQVLRILGQSTALTGAVLQLIQFESGGNPLAINLTDINAQRGDPSRGLMQTIGSTFNAYAGPYRGLGIYNPLANIYAGLNYGISRYGSVSSIPGIASLARGGSYRPYDNGGLLNPGYTLAYNGTGKPETVRTAEQEAALSQPANYTIYAQFGEETIEARTVRVVTEAARIQRQRGRYSS